MKLFNRLLFEGIFVFWDDENECDYYVLDFYINNLEKRIKIKEVKVEGNTRCYSFDKIGNGEYYIEITAYKNEKILSEDNKNVNLSSSNIQFNEIKDVLIKLDESINSIDFDDSNILDAISNLKHPPFNNF